MDETINVAIIGCGKIGYHGYVKNNVDSHYKALNKSNYNFQIDLFDNNSSVAYGLFSSAPNIKYDAIIIAVNTENHFQVYQEALSKRPELIILEKPAGNSVKEIEKMIELGHNKTIVNYTRRLNGDFNHIKSLIKNGSIGETKNVQIMYNKSAKINGCHFIDLMVYFYGPPIDYRKRGKNIILYYPTFECNLQQVDAERYTEQHVHIYGSKSKIELNQGGMEIKIFEKTKHPCGYDSLTHSLTYLASLHDSCAHMPELIKKYINPDIKEVPSNLQDAYHTAKIIHD
jgi:predicted dehydrogenase